MFVCQKRRIPKDRLDKSWLNPAFNNGNAELSMAVNQLDQPKYKYFDVITVFDQNAIFRVYISQNPNLK